MGEPHCNGYVVSLEGRQLHAVPKPDPLRGWDRFTHDARARLEAGRAEYGDRSFSAAPVKLLRELREEALDLACWGYILSQRISDAIDAAVSAEEPRP